ncbi:LytTR family DNA-binding domain-containing protein [Flavobacterium sp.]|uniref:LytTR family DNA-binding domain-containing protein n=1 Tax=Flavobacterium sp. TaxID=239 RepID=UPI002FDC9618
MTLLHKPFRLYPGEWRILSLYGALFLLLVNVVLDYGYAIFKSTGYYIAESLLFSTFWLLYIPATVLLQRIYRMPVDSKLKVVLGMLVFGTHFCVYPALIYVLSRIFYYHTFAFWQTLAFGFTHYFISATLLYSFITFVIYVTSPGYDSKSIECDADENTNQPLTSMLVSDSQNKSISILLSDIYYFSACTPYVGIHHPNKKYLNTNTLKSLSALLDGNRFVRIHKSYIVNVDKVIMCQSRLNGDYDITLTDGTILRVSRVYAKNFKTRFRVGQRVTV